MAGFICGYRTSLNPATSVHVTPPSAERNRPGGDVPAYQTPGSDACAGESQNTLSTERPTSPSAAFLNMGGCFASAQVLPPSCERNTVGPRSPVFAAIRNGRASRGSATGGFTMLARKSAPPSGTVFGGARPRQTTAP